MNARRLRRALDDWRWERHRRGLPDTPLPYVVLWSAVVVAVALALT